MGCLFALLASCILALRSAPVPTLTSGVSLATVAWALVEPTEAVEAVDGLDEEPSTSEECGGEGDDAPAALGVFTWFVRPAVVERPLLLGRVCEAPDALVRWRARGLGARGPPVG